MECPRRWAVLTFLVYFLTVSDVFCEDGVFEGEPQNQLKRDLSRVMNPTAKTVAYVTEAPFMANLMPSQAYYSQEPVTITPNIVLATPCTRASKSQEPASHKGLNQANIISSISSSPNDIYGLPKVNSIIYADATPLNSNNFQTKSSSGSPSDILCENNKSKIQETVLLANGYDEGFPVNLQINLPSQSVPAPKITFVSAAPQSTNNSERNDKSAPLGFPPPFPLVKKQSRSCLRHILPILLISLLSDQGNCGNRCCCPCNCNCNCGGGSDSPVLVPYPIPFPTNNPIINTSSKRTNKNDDDNDDNDNH